MRQAGGVMHRKVALVLVFAGVTGLLALAACSTGRGEHEASRPAPDFTVTRFSDGHRVSLSDLRGKVVLLYFFFPT